MNTKDLPSKYRRRAKRAARKFAGTTAHSRGGVKRKARAMAERELAMRGDHRLTARIADLGELELPEGAVDRAVARARAEGVIP